MIANDNVKCICNTRTIDGDEYVCYTLKTPKIPIRSQSIKSNNIIDQTEDIIQIGSVRKLLKTEN